jgi:hypothetical protein
LEAVWKRIGNELETDWKRIGSGFTGDEDGLKGDNESFAEALLEFLSGPIFHWSIQAEIRWKRQPYRYVPEVGEEFQVGASERTPNEEEREHELNDEAHATAAVLGPVGNEPV